MFACKRSEPYGKSVLNVNCIVLYEYIVSIVIKFIDVITPIALVVVFHLMFRPSLTLI